MSKLDHKHPFSRWLESRKMTCIEASAALGRSPACVSRWIRGIRRPSPMDQERIALFTGGEVPVTVWHEQAVGRLEAA